MADRLEAAAEETLLTVMQDRRAGTPERGWPAGCALSHTGKTTPRCSSSSSRPDEENLEDRMALISGETDEAPDERDVSLRLLRHLASSVRHQQYHDIDVVTVHVNPPPSG